MSWDSTVCSSTCVSLEQLVQEHRSKCLDELIIQIQLHQIHSWRLGQRVPSESYLRLLPELEEDASIALDLIYGEFLLREEFGPTPDPEEFYSRFPNYRDELRLQLSLRDSLTHEDNGNVSQTTDHREEEGEPFGAYALLEVIGRGGMGIVHKAREQSLHRFVALKMIRSGEFSSTEEIQRLQREAEHAASLDHPNIVPIYQVGECKDQHFFAMKLLQGGTLQERLDDYVQPLSAAHLITILSDAVHYAHQRGILHRDLKPTNVLFDSEKKPYLADFGLARRVDHQHSVSHAIVGTPGYMSPEQAGGTAATVAGDVYGLGAILYTLLLGRPPFQHDSWIEVLRLVQYHDPVSPRSLKPEIPKDLQTICLKALRKEPGKRYESALALADDLRCYIEGRPIKARPVGRLERFLLWNKRNPVLAASIAVLVITFHIAFATVFTFWRTAEAHRKTADAEVYFGHVALAEREWEANRRDRALQQLNLCAKELRNWEWKHLSWRLQGSSNTWTELQETSVAALSPDSHHLAVINGQGQASLQIFDVDTRSLLWSVPSLDKVSQLWFSPDGQWIVGQEGTHIVVVSTQKKSLSYRIEVDPTWVDVVSISRDASRFATGGRTGTIKIWDLPLGREIGPTIRCIERPRSYGCFSALRWSVDNTALAVAVFPERRVTQQDRQKTALYSVKDGQLLHSIPDVNFAVSCFDFSPNGKWLAIGALPEDSRMANPTDVRVYDLATMQKLQTLQVGHGHIHDLRFSPDSELLATASSEDVVLIWRTSDWKMNIRQQGLGVHGSTVQIAPDLKHLTLGRREEGVRVCNICAEGNSQVMPVMPSHAVFSMALGEDGTKLFHGDGKGNLASWDTGSQTRLWLKQSAHSDIIQVLSCSSDGTRLASAGRDHTIRIWNATDGQLQSSLGLATSKAFVYALSFSPDGRYLAAGYEGGIICIWDVFTKSVVQSLEAHTTSINDEIKVRGLGYTTNGDTLVSVGHDGRVLFWNTLNWTYQSWQHASTIESMKLSRDGNQLAITSRDLGKPAIFLIDVPTRKLRQSLLAHQGEITSVSFSPDGTRLVSGSNDFFLILWDTAMGRELIRLHGHSASIKSVIFSPDGSRIYSSGWDRTIRIWDSIRN